MLTAQGYLAPRTSTDELQRLLKELTVTPIVAVNMGPKPNSFKLYVEIVDKKIEGKKEYYVPRYFGLQRFGVPAIDTLSEGTLVECEFEGRLRQEQEGPVRAFLKAANDPLKRGGIISLSCGQGKTVISLYLLAKMKRKTMIVVHKDFLLNQWRDRIASFLTGVRIGLIKGPTIDVKDKDVVLASVQSLSMKTYDDEIFDGISFLIVDECHRIGTEVFSRALQKRTFKYNLGLSATVNRKDGMTRVFTNYLGDVVYQGQPRVDTVHVHQERFYDEDPSYSREVLIPRVNKPNISRMINQICTFERRNLLIADWISKILVEDDRKVLVLSDRKEQLSLIKDLLTAMNIESGYYYGGLKAQELAESETKTVLLATFAYAAEGMDCKGLDSLVLASPKSDIEQSCGRILREREKDRVRTPLIFDIVDAFSLFENQGRKRRAYYKKNNYTINSQSPRSPRSQPRSRDEDCQTTLQAYGFR